MIIAWALVLVLSMSCVIGLIYEVTGLRSGSAARGKMSYGGPHAVIFMGFSRPLHPSSRDR